MQLQQAGHTVIHVQPLSSRDLLHRQGPGGTRSQNGGGVCNRLEKFKGRTVWVLAHQRLHITSEGTGAERRAA